MKLHTTDLKASIINAENIELSYSTLPGNCPKSYGNWIGLWQGSVIPYGRNPLWHSLLGSDDSAGCHILGGLQLQRTPYILGYAHSVSLSSISSTVQFIPSQTGEGTLGILFPTTISLVAYNAQGIVISYSTPSGNIPVENGDWIGLCAGSQASFSSENLIRKVDVTQRSNCSSQALTGISLAYKSTYTIVYGCSREETAIAASLTFETGEILS